MHESYILNYSIHFWQQSLSHFGSDCFTREHSMIFQHRLVNFWLQHSSQLMGEFRASPDGKRLEAIIVLLPIGVHMSRQSTQSAQFNPATANLSIWADRKVCKRQKKAFRRIQEQQVESCRESREECHYWACQSGYLQSCCFICYSPC